MYVPPQQDPSEKAKPEEVVRHHEDRGSGQRVSLSELSGKGVKICGGCGEPRIAPKVLLPEGCVKE